MLFNAKEFELSFSATHLKKGLALFEKGKVETTGKRAVTEWIYRIDQAVELILRKRGDSILSYTCSCQKRTLCEHLAAVLFLLQKDALGLSEKRTHQKKQPRQGRVSLKHKNLQKQISLLPSTGLARFFEGYRQEGQAFKETLSAYFSGRDESRAYDFYKMQLIVLLEKELLSDSLNQKQLMESAAKLNGFPRKKTFSDKFPSGEYYRHLAVLLLIPHLLNRRVLGEDALILDQLSAARTALDDHLRKGASGAEKKAWLDACLQNPVKSELGAEVYAFLMPRMLGMKLKSNLDPFKQIVLRQKMNAPGKYGFNFFQVLKLELLIQESGLLKKQLPPKYAGLQEFNIARAELAFGRGDPDQGFRFFEEGYSNSQNTSFPGAYYEYGIFQARENGRSDLEIKYLQAGILRRLYLLPGQLDRLYFLLAPAQRRWILDGLIEQLRTDSGSFSFEKIAAICIKDKRTEQLAKELETQKEPFTMLHKLLFRSLPRNSTELLRLYLRHYTQALLQTSFLQQREYLTVLATRYLERAAVSRTRAVISALLKEKQLNEVLSPFLQTLLSAVNLPA